ncbi:hypothetical protein J2W32_006498 [Variovorax boronicumulans]|uniref:DUF1640 domain-containing protein n=1 Tax=Variovorax boronicumulans TaxID=436515 RepID=A0AAW8D819_9BURK|nr:hypothetical protein [Variovorax boronicumulans]MDP9897345.1 hypothetical protein [Variovorax boronicumulans]MDQ0057421.1 hypothetical protein [Variovorax boronicumulans]
MTGDPKRSALDALHAELLIDVQALAQNVEGFKGSIPKAVADIEGAAASVASATKSATSDFESMGHALIAILRRNISEERTAAIKANHESAMKTKHELEQFTKNFWLLTGLTAVNCLMLLALLLIK